MEPAEAWRARDVARTAESLWRMEKNLLSQLRFHKIRALPEGGYDVVFKEPLRAYLEMRPERVDELEKRGLLKMRKKTARFASTEQLARGLQHILEGYEKEFRELDNRLGELKEIHSKILAAGARLTGKERDEIVEKLLAIAGELDRKREVRKKKLAKPKLERTRELIEQKNLPAACAGLLGAVNRLLRRKKIVDEVIKPWERRRQAVVSDLASLEEGKAGAAKKALSSLKYILSKAVGTRDEFMKKHGPLLRSAHSHAKELERLQAPTPAQKRAISEALERLANQSGHPTVAHHLRSASAHALAGNFGRAKTRIEKAVKEISEISARGLLPRDYRRDIASALGAARLFFWRTPGEHVKKAVQHLTLARNAFVAGRLDETHKRILAATSAYSRPAVIAARLLRGEF